MPCPKPQCRDWNPTTSMQLKREPGNSHTCFPEVTDATSSHDFIHPGKSHDHTSLSHILKGERQKYLVDSTDD